MEPAGLNKGYHIPRFCGVLTFIIGRRILDSGIGIFSADMNFFLLGPGG
jgi:hypothetical protein